jgi:hypothetical protein
MLFVQTATARFFIFKLKKKEKYKNKLLRSSIFKLKKEIRVIQNNYLRE